MPLIRRIGNMFFARLLTIIGRAAVTDSASGMRVFRKSTLELLSPLPDGLNLTPVMSTRAVHERIRVVERPIPYSERQGESKLSVAGDGLRFLSTIVWTALTYNPVRILGIVGLAGIGVALAVALGLVAARLGGVDTLGPTGVFGVFAALVFGVAGVSIFALGAAFNYLVSLFHHRPIRQGLFKQPLLRDADRAPVPAGRPRLDGGGRGGVGSKLRPVPARLADRAPLALSLGQRAPDPRRPPARALVAHHVGARRAERPHRRA